MLPYGLIIYNILGILIQFPLNGLCLTLPSFHLASFSSQQSVNRMHNPVTLPRHFPIKHSKSVPFEPSHFVKNNFATPQLTTVENKNSASIPIPLSSNDEQTSAAKINSPFPSNKLSAGNDTKPLSVMTPKSNTDNIGAVSKSSANNNSPVLTLSPIQLLASNIRLPVLLPLLKQSSSNKNEASSSEWQSTVAASNNVTQSKYKSSVENNNAATSNKSVTKVSVIKGTQISNYKPLSVNNNNAMSKVQSNLSVTRNSKKTSVNSSKNLPSVSVGNGMKVGIFPPLLLVAKNSAVENSSEQSHYLSVNKNSAKIAVKSSGILDKVQPEIKEYSTAKSSQVFPNIKPTKALPEIAFSKSSHEYQITTDNGPTLITSPGRLSDPTVLPRYFPTHNSTMKSIKRTTYFSSRPAIPTNPTPSWLKFIDATNSEKIKSVNIPKRPGAPTVKENSMESYQMSVRKTSESETSIKETSTKSTRRSTEKNSDESKVSGQPSQSYKEGNKKNTAMENQTIGSTQKTSLPKSELLNDESIKTTQSPATLRKHSLAQPNPSDVSLKQTEPSVDLLVANLGRNSLSQPKILPHKSPLNTEPSYNSNNIPQQAPLSKSSAAIISSSLIKPNDLKQKQHVSRSRPPVNFGPEKSLSVKSISLKSFRLPKLVTLNQTLSLNRLKLPKLVTLDKPVSFPNRSFSTPKSKTPQESLSPPKQKQLSKSIVQPEPIKQNYLPDTDKSLSNSSLKLSDLIIMQSYPPAKSFKIKTTLPKYIPKPNPKPSSYSLPKQVLISLPSHSIEKRSMFERPGLPLKESLKLPDLITMQSYPPAKSFKIKTKVLKHRHIQKPKPKASNYSQPKPIPESLPSNTIKKRRPLFETPGVPSIHILPINSHLHDPTVLSRFPPPQNITEKRKFVSLSLSSKKNQKTISDMSKLMWSNETSFELPSLLSFLDSATVGVMDKPSVRGPALPDSFFKSLPSIPSIKSIESQTSCPPCPETAVGFKPFCAMPTSGSLSHNSVLKFPNECLFKLYNCKNPDKQYRQVPTCNLSKSMSKTMSMRPF